MSHVVISLVPCFFMELGDLILERTSFLAQFQKSKKRRNGALNGFTATGGRTEPCNEKKRLKTTSDGIGAHMHRASGL